VFNYWGDTPPLTVDSPDVKWILLANPQTRALFIVLQSWNAGSIDAHVRLDPDRIGFTPGPAAWDAENDAPVQLDGQGLRVPLTGPFGTRVIRIGYK
jgi:hypothetical protein